jgi:serine/threonine-protein kinase HipA
LAYQPVSALEVRIWDQRVGAVALDPSSGYYAFQYAPAFLRSGLDLAPLAMPLARGADPFVFVDLPEATYCRLPALLADALPDRFGNALITAWMATNGVDTASITALDRLAYISTRGMGALTFRPSRGPTRGKSSAVEMASLVEAARKTVHGDLLHDDTTQAALRQIIQLGTSAGGARAKAIVALNPTTHEIRSGQFEIPQGFEAWLLKFDGVNSFKDLGATETYGRIEYAYHLMALDAGVSMSPCQLLEENGRAHFMTKRFDRGPGDQRHHMQTLCSIAHMDYNLVGVHSYEQLFNTVDTMKLGSDAMVETLRRMVFNVASANCDDHPKNFSFLIRQGSQRWELAPAYDITFAYKPGSQWVARHLMSVNGKFDSITRNDVRVLADGYGMLAQVDDVIDQVTAALGRWEQHADAAGVPSAQRAPVTTELKRRSLAKR